MHARTHAIQAVVLAVLVPRLLAKVDAFFNAHVYIQFDNGERHHYTSKSLATGKIGRLDANGELELGKPLTSANLKEGDRVKHHTRGPGVVTLPGYTGAYARSAASKQQ